jgi:uncharacterized protein
MAIDATTSGSIPDGSERTSTPASTGSLLAFFLLTFAVAWACFIPVATSISHRTPLGGFLVLFGTFAPSMVAFTLTARAGGAAGVRAFLGGLFRSRVAMRWFVFAATYMAAIKLAAAVIHRFAAGAWPRFGDTPWILLPFAILISTPVQAGEEIGWRGYALPRLAARLGLGPASLGLGVIWAVWHLPLFFVRGADTYGQSFPLYASQVIALSVAFAWLFARAGGNLLLPMLLHAAVNNTKDIVPSADPGAHDVFGLSGSRIAWIALALLWACAAGFLVWMARTEARRRRDGWLSPPTAET